MSQVSCHGNALPISAGLAALLLALATPPAHAVSAAAELVHWAVQDRSLVMIGEVHGTREAPQLVGELAALMSEDQALVVALELPTALQHDLDAFLDDADPQRARSILLGREFWTREYQDGRSSQAMLELLERLLQLKREGRQIALLAFDQNPGETDADLDRDAIMARNVRAALTSIPMLLLAGNFHVRLEPGTPWDPQQRFLAWHLRDLRPFTLDVTAWQGEYWICTGASPDDCGLRSFSSEPSGDTPRLVADSETRERGYVAQLILERFTASPPALR